VPEPFDFSICLECCGVARYDEEMMLTPVSEEELDLLYQPELPGIRFTQRLIQKSRGYQKSTKP
jgi:hypothetical protein